MEKLKKMVAESTKNATIDTIKENIKEIKAENYSPANPIMVGKPSDWYDYDSEGNVTSFDVKGEPVQNDDTWAAARRTANGVQADGMCIGGSDASVVAGCRPGHENGCKEDTFNSKLKLYHVLRGDKPVVEAPDNTSEIFDIGHCFEDAVAVMAAKKINEQLKGKGLYAILKNDPNMYICGAKREDGTLLYPHAIGDVDRILAIHKISDNSFVMNYGLEIKTTNYGNTKLSKWMRSEYNPLGVPENYETQCRKYMGVMNLQGFFIAVQEFSMKPSDLVIRFIPRDLALEKNILDNEEIFVQRAKAGIPPEEWEDDPVKRMAAMGEYMEEVEKSEEGFTLPDSSYDLIKEYIRLQAAIASSKKYIKDLESQLAEVQIGMSIYFSGDGGEWGTCIFDDEKGISHRYFVRQERKEAKATYDLEKLLTEDPELYERVVTPTIVKTKVKSKADLLDLEKYAIKGEKKAEWETKIKEVDADGKAIKKRRTKKVS